MLAPPAAIRASLLDNLQQVDAPTLGKVRAREAVVTVTAIGMATALFMAIGGARLGPRPVTLVVATAGSSTLLACAAIWMVRARRRTMLGQPRVMLLTLAAALPLLYLACKVAVTSAFPRMDAMWPERPGWRCFRYSLLIAAPLFAGLSYRWLRRDPTHPRATGAALGAVAGACSSVFVDLWCPVAYVPHLLLGHLLPMLLLAALGALLGEWSLGLRARKIG